jgi:hypothetical protein
LLLILLWIVAAAPLNNSQLPRLISRPGSLIVHDVNHVGARFNATKKDMS